MQTAKGTLVALAALIVVAVLSVATWQFGWFVAAKNTDRQVNIDNRNKGTQVAWRDEARNTITDYRLLPPEDTANRGALRLKACSLIPRLTPAYQDADLVAFQSKECA